MASDAGERRLRADMLVRMRRPIEARQILEPLVGADPHDARARVLLAECWRLEGDGERAFSLCRSAAAAAPDDVTLLLDCAEVSRLAGHESASYAWARHALALSPRSVRALNSLTLIEVSLNKPGLALVHGKAALAMAPDDPDLRVAYAMSLQANGLLADATEQYTRVLDQVPTHVYALNNLAAIRMRLGDVHRSARLFSRAIAIDPRLRIASDNIAVSAVSCRRILLALFAVAFATVGLALTLNQSWAYVVAAALLGWTLWSATKVPAVIRRRIASRMTSADVFWIGLVTWGLLVTFDSSALGLDPVVGFLYLYGFGLLVAVKIVLPRFRIDSQLRRRGVRLP